MILAKHVYEELPPIMSAKEGKAVRFIGLDPIKTEKEMVSGDNPFKEPGRKYIGTVFVTVNKDSDGKEFARMMHLDSNGRLSNSSSGKYVPKEILITGAELLDELNNKERSLPVTAIKAFDFNEIILTYELLEYQGGVGVYLSAYSTERGLIARIHEKIVDSTFENLRGLISAYYGALESSSNFYFISNINDVLKITPNEGHYYRAPVLSRSGFTAEHCILADRAEIERFLYELNTDIRLVLRFKSF